MGITRMIERFKTRIVANGQPQILGFDCYEVHAPRIPMPENKLLLAICAHRDMELFQMDTTTAFISAALKPGEIFLLQFSIWCGSWSWFKWSSSRVKFAWFS